MHCHRQLDVDRFRAILVSAVNFASVSQTESQSQLSRMAASSSSGVANRSGVPGQLAPAWTKDVVWQKHVEGLLEFPNGFSILELCVGAGTASIALDLLLGSGRSTLVGAWDISEDVSVIYDCVHGSFAPVHLGERNGDILAIDICEFPCANAVIGGPPCPPFCSVGKRRALADERSQPFTRCIDVIVELDGRVTRGSSSRPLMFFCSGKRDGHTASSCVGRQITFGHLDRPTPMPFG